MLRFALSAAAIAAFATPGFALGLTSPDVADGQTFAAKFVCTAQGGQNVSPALTWTGVPPKAKSLALTIFDPDAGTSGFWHWQLVDIPPTATGIAQGAGAAGQTPIPGARPLPNGAGNANYDGPCPPPDKTHHYITTIYALPDAKSAITSDMKPTEVGAWLDKAALIKAVITPVFEHK